MIHLISVDTANQANELQERFEANGIPVFVQEDYTRQDPTSRSANFGYRIHIWLEEQLEDATQLLRNPEHEVKTPVDIGEFYAQLDRHDEEKEAAWYKAEERWLNWLFGAAALGFIGWILYAATAS